MKKIENANNVAVRYVITQMGKHPFSFEHAVSANAESVTLKGIASKIGYAIAETLTGYAQKAIAAKQETGKYITAFRPKAAFKVEVSVNDVVYFHALQTKGLDAIRLMNGKGEVLSRNAIVAKFELIAESVHAASAMRKALEFEAETEANTTPKPNGKKAGKAKAEVTA
jgi:hypothetical protein